MRRLDIDKEEPGEVPEHERGRCGLDVLGQSAVCARPLAPGRRGTRPATLAGGSPCAPVCRDRRQN